MEISNLVTSDNEKNGKWFQVELYGKKQNFALNILGDDADEVVKFARNRIREIAKNNEKKYAEMTDNEMDDYEGLADDNVIVRLNGISSIKTKLGSDFELIDEPVTLQGRELKNDEESYRFLIEKIPALSMFILNTSRKRSNFLD